jgi:hypothetical protein
MNTLDRCEKQKGDMSEPLTTWWVQQDPECVYTPRQSRMAEGSVAVYLAADVDALLWQREEEVIALKLRVDQLGGFDKDANACEKFTLESPKEELYSWTTFYMRKVTDLKAQLKVMTTERDKWIDDTVSAEARCAELKTLKTLVAKLLKDCTRHNDAYHHRSAPELLQEAQHALFHERRPR